jgi:predicted CopG family antitoxin
MKAWVVRELPEMRRAGRSFRALLLYVLEQKKKKTEMLEGANFSLMLMDAKALREIRIGIECEIRDW